jgi:hypothetical protein
MMSYSWISHCSFLEHLRSRTVSENHRIPQHRWQQNWMFIHLEDLVSINNWPMWTSQSQHPQYHGTMPTTAKHIITESKAQMCKERWHDYKACRSDRWECMIWSDDSSFFTLYPTWQRVYLCLLNTQRSKHKLYWNCNSPRHWQQALPSTCPPCGFKYTCASTWWKSPESCWLSVDSWPNSTEMHVATMVPHSCQHYPICTPATQGHFMYWHILVNIYTSSEIHLIEPTNMYTRIISLLKLSHKIHKSFLQPDEDKNYENCSV